MASSTSCKSPEILFGLTLAIAASTCSVAFAQSTSSSAISKLELENQSVAEPADADVVRTSCEDQALQVTDPDERVAAFLYDNPEVCLWEIAEDTQCVLPVETPSAPGNAIRLPASNGHNDTAAIQSAIYGGGDFVGDGSVYRLSSLQIRSPTRIWNMPSSPANGARKIAEIRSPDVAIYNSLVDGLNQPGFHAGWDLLDGSHRFRLVNSGVVNIRNSSSARTYGVLGAEVDDIHVACNRFDNIISRNSPARVMWMAPGRTGSKIVRGGVFANNYGENIQSGNQYRDADVIVLQGHMGKQIQDRPFLIMANRFVDAGKRLVKWQTGNSKALSNFYHWKTPAGELGGRSLSEAIASFSSNNIARNNHLKYSAEGRVPKTMFAMITGPTSAVSHNNHFNNNLIEYEVNPPARATSTVFLGVNLSTNAASGHEFVDSTFTGNTIIGPGQPLYSFSFRQGWDEAGSSFIHTPNFWDLSSNTRDVYK